MNRAEFMTALEKLLVSISEDERAEALKYYEDYFEDAGAENEEQVIKELGSPEKVAAIIWADTRGNSEESGEFTENGYTDVRFEEKAHPACRKRQGDTQERETSQETKSADSADKTGEHAYSYHETSKVKTGQGTTSGSANQNTGQHEKSGYRAGSGYSQDGGYAQGGGYAQSSGHAQSGRYAQGGGYTQGSGYAQSDGYTQGNGYRAERQPEQMRTNKTLKVILIVVLVLVVLRVFNWLIPAAFSVVAAVLGLIIGLLGLLIGVVAAGAGVAVAGVMVVIAGIAELTTTFAAAILVMGIGMLMTGIGIALAMLALKLSFVVYPAIFRAVVNFVNGLFHGREARRR